MKIKRSTSIVLIQLFVLALAVPTVFAGNPHFTDISAERVGSCLDVSGKEAGLGNETQVHIECTAMAACINPGTKHPKAANKEAFSAGGDFPVQNGKAEFLLTLCATTIDPQCDPPMTIQWSDVQCCDTEHGVCTRVPGTF